MDQIVTGFRAQVDVSTYDMAGRQLEPEKHGYRLYVKPDMSLVCLADTDGKLQVASEIRTVLRTNSAGTIQVSSIPDSYFLRDFGSMWSYPLQIGPRGGIVPKPEFVLEQGSDADGTGVYTLSITYPDYERAILKVNTDLGAVVEKTVYAADHSVKSREFHSDFVPVNSGYLPSHTIYEWAGRRAVIHLWDYHAEAPQPVSYFENAETSCGTLAASYGGRLPVEAALRGWKDTAGR
jgi:hypothetical protein